ncbi:pirin family protein [Nitrincola sp. MINF-07-Sa-05]|uniref:pirin family protein n=1 Tax=Nitrincola salilacus TaxID=3400273 RepID=UPI003917DAD3
MIEIRHAQERGQASFGWLKSQHTFSFGNYHDPKQMGFSALRVINDDHVTPGAGFAPHGHRDMEILTYVLQGQIAHRDSEGNIAHLPAGEFQLMSAGSGITHSEYNASDSDPLHFLQIWILPDVYGQPPSYQQKDFGQKPGLTLVVSPDGEADSLVIKQKMKLYQVLLDAGETLNIDTDSGRRYYLHLIEDSLAVNGLNLTGLTSEEMTLQPGDGARLSEVSQLTLKASNEPVRALLFDLP